MGISVASLDDAGLTIAAPLQPNINHACTAFGGSLAAAATLAGWGSVWLLLRQRDLPGKIVIQESALSYLHPVTGDFIAHCPHPTPKQVDALVGMLDRKGKGRINLSSEILQDGNCCVGFQGRYVVLRSSVLSNRPPPEGQAVTSVGASAK
jgi:thioesterase domain-containing protein